MKLFDVAHSRAGDKGNTLMLSLIPYKEADYEMLLSKATAENCPRPQEPHFGSVAGDELGW